MEFLLCINGCSAVLNMFFVLLNAVLLFDTKQEKYSNRILLHGLAVSSNVIAMIVIWTFA